MQNKKYKKITTIEHVLKAKGIADLAVIDAMFAGVPAEFREDQKKSFIISLIASAINGDWQADWDNTDQNKYYPWYWVEEKESGSGVALSLDVVGCDFAHADVAPRHVFETREQAAHAAKYFQSFYESYYSKSNSEA